MRDPERAESLLNKAQDSVSRRREDAPRPSEEVFRAIFENAGIGVALVDTQGHPVMCNPELQEMLGYTQDELGGMAFTDFAHPDDRELDWQLYQELVAGRRDKYQIEKRYIKRDGQEMWGRLTVTLARGGEGAAKYAIGMVEDISERKRARAALQRRERILEAVSYAAEELLADTSSLHGIPRALARLGEAADVSRVYVFEYHFREDGEPLISQRFEWVAEGVSSELGNLTFQNFAWRDTGFERWGESLVQGRLVQGHTRELPESDRTLLNLQGIKSL